MPTENMLGAYGEWAAGLASDPPRLSFRQPEFKNLPAWRKVARDTYRRALLQPGSGGIPKATVLHRLEHDGLEVEHLQWQLPYGPPTEAVLLKPIGATGKLPAVVGLHDHGGNKYFGLRKITRTSKEQHPLMVQHQEHYYGGRAWANELARRGYYNGPLDGAIGPKSSRAISRYQRDNGLRQTGTISQSLLRSLGLQ